MDVLFSAGYSGFREGMFLSMIHATSTIIDRYFGTYAGNDQTLITNIDKEKLKFDNAQLFLEKANEKNPNGPWLDKTGNSDMIMSLPIIFSVWPGARFIFARRRGIENIASRLRKFPERNFDYHCQDWAANMAAWRATRAKLPASARCEIDQQEMIQQPEAVARRLAAFLAFDESAELRAAETMRGTRAQQTEKDSAARVHSLESVGWSPAQVEMFRRLCGEEMGAYGYTTDERYAA